MIKRANGSKVYSVNFPQEIIEELEWVKGQDLDFKVGKVRVSQIVIISKKDGGYNEKS